MKRAISSFFSIFKTGDIFTKLSFFLMGLSNIARGQIIKGFGYLLIQAGFVYFVINTGIQNLINLSTLGTQEQGLVLDEDEGIFVLTKGDNSMLMLLFGVVTVFIFLLFISVWVSSVLSGHKAEILKKKGKKLPNFLEDLMSLFDGNLHKLLLFLPLVGLIAFTTIPLIYMILIAFTNYDKAHQPPGNLFNWVGMTNFKLMLNASGTLSKTFWPVLNWNIIWAVFATFSNYFLGMLLAILINMKGIGGKKIWRTIFVITIAVPMFVSLMGVRLMLADQGAFNILLKSFGLINEPLPFLTDPTWARVTVIIVNLWVGIPHTMLITTGILMNIPQEMYESARIDGAGAWESYINITLPYMFFVTAPYLITQFVANINNFAVIYFLTEGRPLTLEYFREAGKTDLLVTWLYKLTANAQDYNYAATIGIFVFVICASASLFVFTRTKAFKSEEGFQ